MPTSVLVIGNGCIALPAGKVENQQEQFPLQSFVWSLLRQGGGEDAATRVILLNSYEYGLQVPEQFSACVDRFQLLYGSGLNERLITTTINKHKIETIFYDDSSSSTMPSGQDSSIIGGAKVHLLSLTRALEAVRKADHLPNLVHISLAQSVNADASPSPHQARESAIREARFQSAMAMMNAYATSYRIPIKAVRVTAPVNDPDWSECFHSISKLFTIGSGAAVPSKKVQIVESGLSACPQNKRGALPPLDQGRGKPAARLLIYGSKNFVGSNFTALCRKRDVEAVEAKVQPGLDPDPDVAAEIDAVAPSHVLYMINSHAHGHCNAVEAAGAKNPTSGGTHLNGEGPTHLLHNMQRHFYSAWTLANACTKRGIHFTYVGTNSMQTQKQLLPSGGRTGVVKEEVEEEGSMPATDELNCYGVVEHWTSRSLALFDPTMGGGILRVYLQFPFSGECSEGNFLHHMMVGSANAASEDGHQYNQAFSATHLPSMLPLLLELVLHSEKGEFNLVNAQPLTITGVRATIREGKFNAGDHSNAEKEAQNGQVSTGQVLSSSKLAERFPEEVGRLSATEKYVEEAMINLTQTSLVR